MNLTPKTPEPTPGSSSSSVHPVETTDDRFENLSELNTDSRPPQTTSQWRMHRRHEHRRAVIIDALQGDPDDAFRRQVDRMWDCCRYPSIWDTPGGTVALSLSRCKCRLCPLCADARARECSRRTEELVRTMNAPRFITLTVRAETTSLSAQLDALSAAFRRLRSRASWSSHVTSSVYALEITYNASSGLWHPHLHVIADGIFWSHASLKEEWISATSGSSVVDIRAVPDRKRAAHYIAAYVSKPADVERWPPEKICEYADAIHGRRMLHTTGKLHGKTPDKDTEEETGKCTQQICSLATIRNAAEAADPRAIRAVELMQRMGGFWRRLTLYDNERNDTPATPLTATEHAELRTLIIAISDTSPAPHDAPPPPPTYESPPLFDCAPAPPCAQRHR
jgi:hypothetical protein